jgi:hypothetical protein
MNVLMSTLTLVNRLSRDRGHRLLRLSIVGFAAATFVALASPASSIAAKSVCQAYGGGNLCLWADAGYNGTTWAWGEVHHDPWGQYIYVGNTFNDQASAVYCTATCTCVGWSKRQSRDPGRLYGLHRVGGVVL